MEEALYDSQVIRDFAGIDLGEKAASDDYSTELSSSAGSERHGCQAVALDQCVFGGERSEGVTGTIVDANIINAPTSTKNCEKARNSDMRQTKKGTSGISG